MTMRRGPGSNEDLNNKDIEEAKALDEAKTFLTVARESLEQVAQKTSARITRKRGRDLAGEFGASLLVVQPALEAAIASLERANAVSDLHFRPLLSSQQFAELKTLRAQTYDVDLKAHLAAQVALAQKAEVEKDHSQRRAKSKK